MSISPASRLHAVAALAGQRPIPWDEARAEQVARCVAKCVHAPLPPSLRSFAWVGVASLAALALYLPLLRGAAPESPVSSTLNSESATYDADSELDRPLGDGGLEASTDTLAP